MKNLITLLFCTLLSAAQAQDYLNTTLEWEEYSISCGGGNPYCTSYEYTIRLDAGDTLINGLTYFKTHRNGIKTTWDWTVDTLVEEIILDDFLFPIREDAGQYFVFNIFQENDQLLHNFNLSIGDTAVSNCSNLQIVKEIDTLYFGSQTRKRFVFEPQLTQGNSPLIEGVGTTRGLFVKPCSGVIGIESGSSLLCFASNNDYLQIDTSGSCETTTPVSTRDIAIADFKIYPNPSTGNVNIELPKALDESSMVKIYDLQGNLMTAIQNNTSAKEFMLPTGDLPSGIYLIMISTEEDIFAQRMIRL